MKITVERSHRRREVIKDGSQFTSFLMLLALLSTRPKNTSTYARRPRTLRPSATTNYTRNEVNPSSASSGERGRARCPAHPMVGVFCVKTASGCPGHASAYTHTYDVYVSHSICSRNYCVGTSTSCSRRFVRFDMLLRRRWKLQSSTV